MQKTLLSVLLLAGLLATGCSADSEPPKPAKPSKVAPTPKPSKDPYAKYKKEMDAWSTEASDPIGAFYEDYRVNDWSVRSCRELLKDIHALGRLPDHPAEGGPIPDAYTAHNAWGLGLNSYNIAFEACVDGDLVMARREAATGKKNWEDSTDAQLRATGVVD